MLREPSVFGFSLTCALTAALAAAAPALALLPQPKVHPAGIPAGAVRVSKCIAGMGEHWVNPKNAPNGPIYGVWHGKPVFTEMMLSVKQLAAGVSYANLRALPGYGVDHVDFEFEPHGHRGFPVPHYDLHLYYVSPAAQARICPDGVPDSSLAPVRL